MLPMKGTLHVGRIDLVMSHSLLLWFSLQYGDPLPSFSSFWKFYWRFPIYLPFHLQASEALLTLVLWSICWALRLDNFILFVGLLFPWWFPIPIQSGLSFLGGNQSSSIMASQVSINLSHSALIDKSKALFH